MLEPMPHRWDATACLGSAVHEVENRPHTAALSPLQRPAFSSAGYSWFKGGASWGRPSNPNGSGLGPRPPGPTAPTAAAMAAGPPKAVLRSPRGRRSCRPSHGTGSSSGKGPSPGPTGRPGTSGGGTWEPAEEPPGRCPRPAPAWMQPGRRPPAHRCTDEPKALFACWYSCRLRFPLGMRPKRLHSR